MGSGHLLIYILTRHPGSGGGGGGGSGSRGGGSRGGGIVVGGGWGGMGGAAAHCVLSSSPHLACPMYQHPVAPYQSGSCLLSAQHFARCTWCWL